MLVKDGGVMDVATGITPSAPPGTPRLGGERVFKAPM